MISEIRDPYTAGHQLQVSRLAVAIAAELDLPEKKITALRMAGTLHDIGKINIPSEILSKPGRLNRIEFELIKTHPVIGRDILKSIDFPWPICQIVLQHHERLDGSGYPASLTDEEICIEAKILGVADVVSAMSCHRPYHSALGVNQALEEITRKRGTLYDPGSVDACYRLFTEKGFQLEG
jgi:putative nucleotidyltransferase with HDIG domain